MYKVEEKMEISGTRRRHFRITGKYDLTSWKSLYGLYYIYTKYYHLPIDDIMMRSVILFDSYGLNMTFCRIRSSIIITFAKYEIDSTTEFQQLTPKSDILTFCLPCYKIRTNESMFLR